MRRALIGLGVLGLFALDVAAMWWVADMIGWQWLIAILAAQFAIGVSIARRAGASAFRKLADASRVGSLPDGRAGESGLIALGGGLLAFPDLLSDFVALVLLLPWTRRWARRVGGARIGRYLRAAGLSTTTSTNADGVTVTRMYEGSVIEGEVVRRHPEEPDSGTNSESKGELDG